MALWTFYFLRLLVVVQHNPEMMDYLLKIKESTVPHIKVIK
jgi:hypothetical protein